MKPLFALLLVSLIALPSAAFGQKNSKQQDPFQNPFANPVDDHSLPRVLIVGDSISIGYTPRVRRLLDHTANVHRPTTNCRWSAFGVEQVAAWVGESKWDVIHFNFGLWDWYGWSQEDKATPESYAKSLESIVVQLKKTDAELIFALTTPPCVGPERKVKIVITEQRAQEFNNAAIAVMKKHGVQINDLYAAIGKNRAKYQRGENDVHYTDQGRDVLADRVARSIRAALPGHVAASRTEDPATSDVGAVGVDVETSRRPFFAKGSRLVFQGDSITDMKWGRRESDRNHYLGHSYVFLIAARLGVEMPEAQLDFYNRGKSGNKAADLRKRWQTDAIDMKPDLLTILVGTNDVSIGLRDPDQTVSPAAFETDYRALLDASRKANPNLRLVLMDPFVLPTGPLKNQQAYAVRRAATDKLCVVVATLAKKYDAVHVRTQDIFDNAAKAVTPEHWMWDGVHPLPQGHELIARHWLKAVSARWHKR